MKIEVTQQDISRGQQADANTCAIARAIRRQTGIRNVSVTGISASIGGKHYRLPEPCSTFVSEFDRNKSWVKPFSFTIKGLKATAKVIWGKVLSPIQPVKSPLQTNTLKSVVTK